MSVWYVFEALKYILIFTENYLPHIYKTFFKHRSKKYI